MLSNLPTTPNSATTPSLQIINAHSPTNPSEDSSNVDIPQYPHKAGKWTIEEDDLLRKYVEVYGEKQWRQISQHIPGRTSVQCLHRWSKILRPGLVKGPWTVEEDQKLMAWVKAEGPNKWTQATTFIVGRSGKQCRERWFNNLNPDVKKCEWTKEEDELVFQLYTQYGSSWSKIAKLVPGRTENSIKNRFYSSVRKLAADKRRTKDSNNQPEDHTENEEADQENSGSEKDQDESLAPGQNSNMLYKLLQKNTQMDEELNDGSEKDIGSGLLKEAKSLFSRKYQSQQTMCSDNDEKIGSARSIKGLHGNRSLTGEDGSALRFLSGESLKSNARSDFTDKDETNQKDFERLLLQMDKRMRDNFLQKELEQNEKRDDLIKLELLQQRASSFSSSNINSISTNFQSLMRETTGNSIPRNRQFIEQEVQIPTLMKLPIKQNLPGFNQDILLGQQYSHAVKKGIYDLSNKVEIRLEDPKRMLSSRGLSIELDSPIVPRLKAPTALLPKFTNSGDDNNLMKASRIMSIVKEAPILSIPNFNNKTRREAVIQPEASDFGLPIFVDRSPIPSSRSLVQEDLKCRREMSFSDQITVQSTPVQRKVSRDQVVQKEAPASNFDMKLQKISEVLNQNPFKNLFDEIKGSQVNQGDGADTKMTFLFSQLHSLESLFTGVKDQLMQLETSLKESRANSAGLKKKRSFEGITKAQLENRIIDVDAKRALEDVYECTSIEQVSQQLGDTTTKKIKSD